MFFRACGFAATLFLLICPHTASGAGTVSVQYNLISLGGNVYRYVYSITNNSGTPVKLFDILFDPNCYQAGSLQSFTPSSLLTQWSEQFLAPVPPIPAAYDVLAISGNVGIQPGNTVTGFSVQLTWTPQPSCTLGSVPGSQQFQIFDPSSPPFQLLQTGQTFSSVTVPASSTLSLILLGIGLAVATAYHAREQNRRMQPQPSPVDRS